MARQPGPGDCQPASFGDTPVVLDPPPPASSAGKPGTARPLEPWGPRIVHFLLRLGLGAGLLIHALFYLIVISRTGSVDVMYTFNDPAVRPMLIFDCVTVPFTLYWVYLIVRIRRVKGPLVPFVVFFLHAVVLPFVLAGDHAVFVHFRRMGCFFVGYPLALGTLSIWLAGRTAMLWWRRSRAAPTGGSR